MNKASREKFVGVLRDHLKAPCAVEEDDDFVNCELPRDAKGRGGMCRVFRVIGDGRYLTKFVYVDDPFAPFRYQTYDIHYLNKQGHWVRFDPRAILADATKKDPRKYSYDKIVGEWLKAHHAAGFSGTDWVYRLGNTVMTQLPFWICEHEKFLLGLE
jgi:hypothetical protein